MKFHLQSGNKDPIYHQIVVQAEHALHEGSLKAGEQIPSMNELAAQLDISRETVKKAYGILVDKGAIVPKQGKGFYAADVESPSARSQVLVIFDKFSVYKQILYNALAERLGDAAEITIVNHNQSTDLLEYYLDNYLDHFDYYVITPHFPLDETSQARAVKQLSRIPYRKLLMLDRLQPGFHGNFGAVYQDFENDIYGGLMQGMETPRHSKVLKVITLPSSLYGSSIRKGIERFSTETHIPVEFITETPAVICKGDTFLVLNSQLDAGLVQLAHRIQECQLKVGEDVRIISYNEADMYELILGGLTTVSTDFREMGRLAADMILKRHMEKLHCPFRMNRRSTF